jgi:1-acyl-sn-glycerol-3-phosphate acyltransferase
MYGFLMRLVEMPWFYWTVRALFWAFAKVAFGLRIEHAERVPREGGLVMAVNHISAWDPPVMGSSVPREISFMAKRELFDDKAMALLVRGLHAFPVDRSRSDISAVKEAMRRLKDGRAVGVFVQGTRSEGDAEALDGAAFLAQRAGVPLQPAAIWREGRRFRVRFGEPFEVPGRDRDAIRAATATTMDRVRGLMPSGTRFPPSDEVDAKVPVGRDRTPSE